MYKQTIKHLGSTSPLIFLSYLCLCAHSFADNFFYYFVLFFCLFCCLCVFDLRILITPLVSANSSCVKHVLVVWVAWRVSCEKQEPLTLRKHLSSSPFNFFLLFFFAFFLRSCCWFVKFSVSVLCFFCFLFLSSSCVFKILKSALLQFSGVLLLSVLHWAVKKTSS